MKLRRRPLPFSILLLYILPLTQAEVSVEHVQALAEGKRDIPPTRLSPEPSLSASLLLKPTPATAVGTKDAPVDGKDGKPHAGPFVETEGQRDRKKAKESGEEEVPPSGKKPGPKEGSKVNSYPDGWDPAIPKSNDGVMDDPHRPGPKEGTRGTEGGISEKNKDRKLQEGQPDARLEKKPDAPKEAPPLPHSEQEKLDPADRKDTTKTDKADATSGEEKPKGLGGLEKPTNLPEKPHDIPHPVPPSASKEDPLKISKPPTSPKYISPTEPTSLIEPLHSYLLSLTMIIFSEIGDKTFLIAALMAMKYDRLLVFSAAFGALAPMTILSAIFGHAVPALIPKRLTSFLAAALFLVFGIKMLREGFAISPDAGVSEEIREVEEELEEKEELARRMGRRRSSITPYMLESGRIGSRKTRSNSRLPAPPVSPPSSPDSRSPSPSRGSSISSALTGINNLFSLLLSPVWVQTFVMTFLGEWGDRSQIATIAMAAGQDYWWVTAGAVTGHAVCTAVAVIGGRAIAGKVSLRVVTLGGAGAFLVFGVIYLIEAIYYA